MNFLVPDAKIVDYLLTNPRKSGFFLRLGYTVENWMQLRDGVLKIASENAGSWRRTTAYGNEYEIIGNLQSPRVPSHSNCEQRGSRA